MTSKIDKKTMQKMDFAIQNHDLQKDSMDYNF